MDSNGDPGARFPKLPILSAGELPPLGQREKYGGLLYLGIGGLVVLVIMIGWFGYAAWSLRDVWRDVYVLHDVRAPLPDRLAAASRLARSPRFGDDQRLELALERALPDRARHALAEGVSTDLLRADPRGFSLAVARSPGWPGWLRIPLELDLVRGVIRGYSVPPVALEELARNDDPMIAALALFAQAVERPGEPFARKALEVQAAGLGSRADLANRLLGVLDLPAPNREPPMDDISRWLREHHEPTVEVLRP